MKTLEKVEKLCCEVMISCNKQLQLFMFSCRSFRGGNLEPPSSFSVGSIKPRSSREKAYILQSIIRIEGINPFSGAIAGEAFANLVGFFRVFLLVL